MAKTKKLAESRKKPMPSPVGEKKPATPEKKTGSFPTASTKNFSSLPPSNGTPSAARAANLLNFPGQGIGTEKRARMASAMQRSVGNARMSRMIGMAPASTTSIARASRNEERRTEEGPVPTTPGFSTAAKPEIRPIAEAANAPPETAPSTKTGLVAKAAAVQPKVHTPLTPETEAEKAKSRAEAESGAGGAVHQAAGPETVAETEAAGIPAPLVGTMTPTATLDSTQAIEEKTTPSLTPESTKVRAEAATTATGTETDAGAEIESSARPKPALEVIPGGKAAEEALSKKPEKTPEGAGEAAKKEDAEPKAFDKKKAEGEQAEAEKAGREAKAEKEVKEEEKIEGAKAEAGEEATGVAGGEAAAAVGPAGAAAGGPAPSIPIAAGGEPQGGSEEEGEAELEERLAKADPERAAADEADPAEVAMGETGGAEADETEVTAPESASTGTEAGMGRYVPTPGEMRLETPETVGPEISGAEEIGTGAIEGTPAEPASESPTLALPETEAVDVPETIEEEPAAEGFSGDEPALGAGAIQQSEAPDLSEPEKKVALESIGESSGGGGEPGGGGGGGSAVPEKPPAEVPDVSSEEPGTALAKIGHLPPAQLKQALGGVSTAVSKSAGDKRAELAANPPEMERPTGSPKNLHGRKTSEDIAAGKAAKKVDPAAEGQDTPTPEPEALPEPPPAPVEKVKEPAIEGTEKGELSERDVKRMSSSIQNLPTMHPGLQATGHPAPQVDLTGNADPGQTDEQRQKLQASVTETQAEGRRDVAQEMGENTRIYPSVAPETLTAKIPEGGGAGGKGGAPAAAGEGSADQDALSIIAQEEKGGEIQTAVAKAQGDMAAKKEEYSAKVSDEKAKSAKEITALEAKSAADQAQARSDAQAEVRAKKSEWSQEQEQKVREANKEADGKVAEGRIEVQKQKKEADRQAVEHIKKGDEEADRERRKAEKKAAEEKRKGKKKSSGFFGWLASKAKAFFNKIKAAIKAAFELARKAIKKAIDLAKKAAMWAIEKARKAIVAAIKVVGKALIAIGDRLLAAFPALRDKFRKFIQDKVDKAVKKVNEYAEKLKKDAAAALDALAAGLDKLIGWLEKGMLAVVDAVATAVDGAIKFAEKVAQAIGAFVSLIKDVASGPLQWLKNLGAGVVDGIKNHLWKAFKEALQEWFNSKLEQVLGLGKMVWDLIKSGGLALAQVGKLAWEGLKAMIPPTLVRILVEKLVAMLVPAAGAVMVIIEGLKAAWGAIKRILAAFQKFFAFLKAVKTGNAGPPFASALAAAAIAVIDFVANWLIAKLAKGASKVGGKIKALAKKILGRKKGRAKGKKERAKSKAKPPKRKPKPKKPPKAKKPPKKGKDKKADKKKEKERKKRERLDKAAAALRPKVDSLLIRGVSGLRLRARLGFWRIRYRLSSLTLSREGEIVATVNPRKKVRKAYLPHGNQLRKLIHEVAKEILKRQDVKEATEILRGARAASRTTPAPIVGPTGFPGAVRYFRERGGRVPKWGRVQEYELKGSGIVVSESQRRGAFNAFVREVGTYPEIAKELQATMKSTGMSDAEVASAVRRLIRGGTLSPRLKESSETLGGLSMLMFGREAARNPATVAFAPMTVDLIARGEMTWKQALAGSKSTAGGGAFPMSMTGAVAASRGLEAEAKGESPGSVDGGTKKQRRELKRREIALAERWLRAQIQAEGLKAFKNRSQAKSFIRKKILQFYKMPSSG